MNHGRQFHSRFPNFGFDRLPWGVECDDGWIPVVNEFLILVAAMVSIGEFSLLQVKEKFGALQIYYTLSSTGAEAERRVHDARRLAFQRSLHVCEVCGKRGRLNLFAGLYKTVCEDHAHAEYGDGVPVEISDDGTGHGPYRPETDSFVKHRPTAREFHAGPLLVGWCLADHGRPWLHGWFFEHPEIADGTHGHTAPLLRLDDLVPPQWARTEDRLYRLGAFYHPAEREIRYWAQKQSRTALERGTAPGGLDEVNALLAFLRSTHWLSPTKIDQLERAYLKERERLGTTAHERHPYDGTGSDTER